MTPLKESVELAERLLDNIDQLKKHINERIGEFISRAICRNPSPRVTGGTPALEQEIYTDLILEDENLDLSMNCLKNTLEHISYLDHDDQAILNMLFIEKKSPDETASHLGISRASLYRKRLRAVENYSKSLLGPIAYDPKTMGERRKKSR